MGQRRERRHVSPPVSPEQLLTDVSQLRLTLSADLSIAAAALESGHPEIAAEAVAHDRAEVAAFEQRALRRLAELASARDVLNSDLHAGDDVVVALPAPRGRRSTGSIAGASLAAAAAAIAGLLSLAAAPPQSAAVDAQPASQQLPLSELYAAFSDAALTASSADEVIAAADELHRSLAPLIARAALDPAVAQQVMTLLQRERALLLESQPPGVQQLLDRTHRLLARVTATLPVRLPAVPRGTPSETTEDKRAQREQAEAGRTPQKSPSASSTPRPTDSQPAPQQQPATTPAPSRTPEPSSSPTPPPGPVLPGDIGAGIDRELMS